MKKLLFGTLVMILAACAPNYSEGERAGTLLKLSHKGLIWKSWEGEMDLGGFRPNSEGRITPNYLKFSVSDPKVAQELNQYVGKQCTLTYRQWLVKPPTVETRYDVTAAR